MLFWLILSFVLNREVSSYFLMDNEQFFELIRSEGGVENTYGTKVFGEYFFCKYF